MIDIDKKYFHKIDNFLDLKTCESLKNKFFDLVEINSESAIKERDKGREEFYSIKDHDIFKKFTNKVVLQLSELLKKDLAHSYTYITLYKPGAKLYEHVDRPHSQYGININLWKNTEWPIFLKHPETKEIIRIDQNPGDAFIYKGIEVPHFRSELKEGDSLQFMVFAVEKNTPYEQFADDKFAENSGWNDCEYPNKEEHLKIAKYYSEKIENGIDINEEYLRSLGL